MIKTMRFLTTTNLYSIPLQLALDCPKNTKNSNVELPPPTDDLLNFWLTLTCCMYKGELYK